MTQEQAAEIIEGTAPPEVEAQPLQTEQTEQAQPEVTPVLTDEQKEQHKQDAIQKRFNKLTRQKHDGIAEADARAETLRQENEQLRADALAPIDNGEPKPEDFDFDDAQYQSAMVDYKVDQKFNAFQQNQLQNEANNRQKEVNKSYSKKAAEFMLKTPDFDEVVMNLPISFEAGEVLKQLENGPEVGYHLGNHLDEADSMAGMNVTQMTMYLTRLSDSVSATVPTKKITEAPPPIDSLNSGAGVQKQTKGPVGATYEQEAKIMANTFDTFTREFSEIVLDQFDSKRVLTKNVDTQLLEGKFNPNTGENFDFKRPTDYTSIRSATGDVSGSTADNIITGKATGTVQDYFTILVDFDEADEALKMGNLEKLLNPMTTRAVTDFEIDFGAFMAKNTALLAGTVGTAATTWDHVAEGGSVLESAGVPMDSDWIYSVNPYTKRSLASDQRGLGAGGVAGGLISEAHRKAILSEDMAGLRVMSTTSLASYATDAEADRAGTLSGSPDVTYLTAKDTMTQSLAIAGIGAGAAVIKAGETIQITAASGSVDRLNLSTRTPVVDDTGSQVVWTATVTADVTLSGGAGTIVVTGPAIFETGSGNGAYNTVTQAPVSGDVITILGAASDTIQPNMFWHKQAFSVGSVPIKKLFSTDTIATTEDGLQLRVSRGSGFLENQQKVRVDFRPAYAALNPFFAGKGFGRA